MVSLYLCICLKQILSVIRIKKKTLAIFPSHRLVCIIEKPMIHIPHAIVIRIAICKSELSNKQSWISNLGTIHFYSHVDSILSEAMLCLCRISFDHIQSGVHFINVSHRYSNSVTVWIYFDIVSNYYITTKYVVIISLQCMYMSRQQNIILVEFEFHGKLISEKICHRWSDQIKHLQITDIYFIYDYSRSNVHLHLQT